MCGAIFRRIDECGVCDTKNPELPPTARRGDNTGNAKPAGPDSRVLSGPGELCEAAKQPSESEELCRVAAKIRIEWWLHDIEVAIRKIRETVEDLL